MKRAIASSLKVETLRARTPIVPGPFGLAIPNGTPDMRATIEHGLGWLQEYKSPRADDAFLLAPGDHPAFGASVVSGLREAFSGLRSKSIVVPTHAGKQGHPVLIGWQHVAGIKEMAMNRGVNAYLRQKSKEIHELETDDRGILFNLDSPEDFVALNCQDSLSLGKSDVRRDLT